MKRAHLKVKHGQCPVCGHYGEDCTGIPSASPSKAIRKPKETISPSPWRLSENRYITDCNSELLADCFNEGPHDLANARVMAFAPELLRACVLALGRDDIADSELGDVLRTAIFHAVDTIPTEV